VNLPATTVVVPSGVGPLQRSGGAAETGGVRPRLLAIALLVSLAACGGAARPPAAPSIGCTITLGDAVQKVTAVVKDLEGTVVVRG
jgi:hypothetical protein